MIDRHSPELSTAERGFVQCAPWAMAHRLGWVWVTPLAGPQGTNSGAGRMKWKYGILDPCGAPSSFMISTEVCSSTYESSDAPDLTLAFLFLR